MTQKVTLVTVECFDMFHGSVDEVGGVTLRVCHPYVEVVPAVAVIEFDFDAGPRSYSGDITLSKKDAEKIGNALLAYAQQNAPRITKGKNA